MWRTASPHACGGLLLALMHACIVPSLQECKISNERFQPFLLEIEGHFLSCSLTLKDIMSAVCHRMGKYRCLIEPIAKNYLYHMNELNGTVCD